jgi:lysophospholipase L1-like esterase
MSALDPFAAISVSLARGCPQRRVATYAALGDSFTAGRGLAAEARWTDRLASSLRARQPDLACHNLAVDGATSAAVLDQVGPAIQLEPDVVTVICGANDVISSVRPDLDLYGRNFAAILDRLARGLPRVAILTATSPEGLRFLELRPRTRTRVVDGIRRLNQVTRRIAASRSIPVLDVAAHPGLEEPANFLADGLHPSAAGHARAAVEIERALREHFGIEGLNTTKEER